MTPDQYTAMRAMMVDLLSISYPLAPNPSQQDVLGFFNGLFTAAAGAPALPAAEQAAMAAVCRYRLSGNFQNVPNPNDADVLAFFAQLQADSAGAAAIPTLQNRGMRIALHRALSSNPPNSVNPSDTEVLGFINAMSASVPNPAAPMVLAGGQSNMGNQDTTTTGWVSDPRVAFYNTTDVAGLAITGPVALGPIGGGHSFELSCGSDLAAHYSSAITVAKTWSDGQDAIQFNRSTSGSVHFPALQGICAATRLLGPTQVAFIWCQGENEAATVSAQTANWQAQTAKTWASIRAQFKAAGINKVRFYLVQTNANLSTVSGISPANLTSVIAQQVALAAADADAILISADDIVPAAGLHYASGQTLTIGSRIALQIAADFTAAQPARATPPTLAQFFTSAVLLQHVKADIGIATAVGSPVTTWTDQSGNGNDRTAATHGGVLTASQLIGKPGVQFGTGGVNTNQTDTTALNLPAPGTTPTFIFGVFRQDGYAAGAGRIFGNSGAAGLIQFGTTPTLQQYNNGTISNPSSGAAIGAPVRFKDFFNNATTDFMTIGGASKITGANTGNTALGVLTLAAGNGGHAAVTFFEWAVLNRAPTYAEEDYTEAYISVQWGQGLIGNT